MIQPTSSPLLLLLVSLSLSLAIFIWSAHLVIECLSHKIDRSIDLTSSHTVCYSLVLHPHRSVLSHSEGMDTADEVVDRPPPEFQEDVKDPVIDLSLTDSTELWLIQWPINQAVDFDGQELSLKLHHDGLLGSFEGSSGKSYDVVSYNAEVPNATVFLSSASESKIVGKISRRVSLVHYPEPSELEKQNTSHQNQMYQRSSGTSLTNSSHCFATHTQSTRPRSSKSSGSNAASMRSSKYTSSLSEIGEPSKPPKRKHIEEPTRSMDQFTQDSGRGHSVVTSSGSLEQSNDRKSRKKKKLVE